MGIYKNNNGTLEKFSGSTRVDSALSADSENPVQNKVIDAEIKNLSQAITEANQLITNLQALRASPTTYGMTKVTDSSAVTDSTGLALAATEKNATIQGTLANKLAKLNTDYFANDTHKNSASIATWLLNGQRELMMCTQDGQGNVSRLVNNISRPYTLETYHSTDYGATFEGFSVGTPPTDEKANGFYVCTNNNSGDDSRDMFIRLVNRHNRCMDVHFYFVPNASPKLSAYVQRDDGFFEQVWTLG